MYVIRQSDKRQFMSGMESLPGAYTCIVTYGRSGSTLLQNMLNSIPGYQIRGENNNVVLHLARSWNAVRKSEQMKALRDNQVPTDQTHPWFGAENVYPTEYGRDLAETFVRSVLKPDPGIRVSGFKEIRFHSDPGYFWVYLNFLYENLPNVRFVFNTRNHDNVARSGWWVKQDANVVKRTLEQADDMFMGYMRHFPDRCYRLHYDDYVSNPSHLQGLFEFINEPFDTDMVERVMATRLSHLHSRV